MPGSALIPPLFGGIPKHKKGHLRISQGLGFGVFGCRV